MNTDDFYKPGDRFYEPVNANAKGLLVFYVNVGQLPPFKAEAFIERMKDKFRLEEVKKVCEVVYIPVRDQKTKVEYISFE